LTKEIFGIQPKKTWGGIGIFSLELAAAVTKAACQGKFRFFQIRKEGSYPINHSLADELRGILCEDLSIRQNDSGMLDSEMIEDTIRIVNDAIKDKIQVTLIINNRAGGNAPLIAQKIDDRLEKERQQRLL
jgi:hypothetical protein